MLGWVKVLAVLFVLPVFAVIFFGFAPRLENGRIIDQFIEGIGKSDRIEETKAQQIAFVKELKLYEHCGNTNPESVRLIEELQVQDVCQDFQHFQLAQMFAGILIVLGLLHLFITFAFAQRARSSREALLSSYRLSWGSATLFSLIILLGQTALGAYTFFYFTVLLTGHYLPKLILALVIAGGWAFFKSAQMLVKKIPIEPQEHATQAVEEKDAPALWETVRGIAKKLDTAPPDTILMGMSSSFYVTEFPVRHAGGVSQGRTLFLSAPMMQQMPKDELVAIIGHELGHFKGEDTKMTREMTPLLVKSETIMQQLAGGGIIAMPALYAMNVSHYLFEKAISAFRRERELHADAFAVSVSKAKTMATALVRYTYQSEAYMAGFHEHLTKKAALEASVMKFQDELKRDDGFWENISAAATPHPFDSHPPMTLRLEKLGYKVADVRADACGDFGTSAFDSLIKGKAEVLKAAMQEHESSVQDAQNRLEIKGLKADEMGADLIQRHFPQIVLQSKTWRVVFGIAILGFLFIGLPILLAAVMADIEPWVRMLIGAVAIPGAFATYWFARDSWGQTLTINHLGIQHSSWKEMLKFEDVAQIQHMIVNHNDQIHFTFKEKRDSLKKKVLIKMKSKKVAVDYSGFEGKPIDNVKRTFRYYLKEIEG